MSITQHEERESPAWLPALGILLLALVILRNAWVCDDAYISFRVVDNFVNGYGLTWNTVERVQAFTNPLWVLLVSTVYFFSREAYFTSLALSTVLSLTTAYLLIKRISTSVTASVLAVTILVFSKSFIDYTTSGLENPLSFLLLIVFVMVYLNREPDLKTFFWLSLLASLAMLNRMDTILIYGPALLYFWIKVPLKKGLIYGLVGFTPFLVWELFALIYYGFPFPNTYYAKLHTGLPSSELAVQGLIYFLDSLTVDPLTLFTIGSAITLVVVTKTRKAFPLVLGMLFYLVYIVRIGGDFMSGRFFAVPLLLSVAIIAHLWRSSGRLSLAGPFAIVLLLGLAGPWPPPMSGSEQGKIREQFAKPNGIVDERGWYYQSTGLLLARRGTALPNHDWLRLGDSFRTDKVELEVLGCVGFVGYASGPQVYLIDRHGLSEPLLSRLPTFQTDDWRPGHFTRRLPPGYFQTLQERENLIEDSLLAIYYDKLKIITRGKIWSFERFAEIVKFNLGYNDHLLDSYVSGSDQYVAYVSFSEPPPPSTAWNADGNIILKIGSSLSITMDSTCHATRLEISVDNNDYYWLIYYRGERELARDTINKMSHYGLRTDTINVRPIARIDGFDRVRIAPWKGDGLYSVGHLRLLEDADE